MRIPRAQDLQTDSESGRQPAYREAALPTRMASKYRAAGRNRARLERFLREVRPMLRPAQPAPLR